MRARIETPPPPDSELFGGEFHRGTSFFGWRPRGTPDWLLIYTDVGGGSITTPKGTATTEPGDIILYSPGDFQNYKTDPAKGRWHLLWVHFLPKPAWQPWLQWPTGRHGVKMLHLEKGEVRDSFIAAMRRMIHISRRKLPNARNFALNALEEALLWAHVAAGREPWMRTDTRVHQAMDYLTANLQQPFSLDALSRHCGLSVSRLAHIFKKGTGISPQQFFEQQRMWQASQLLRLTNLGIAEVATEVGYDCAFYFSNRFRRYSGKSPSRFRRDKKF